MKNLIITLFLLINFCSFSQTKDVEDYFKLGNEAFQENDFETAKENYIKVIQIDEKHEDAYFNLAITELNLKESELACEHLNKSYQLGVFDAFNLIIEYCGKLSYSERMWIRDLEELPQFKKEEKVFPLFFTEPTNFDYITNIKINPKFSQHLLSIIKKDKELRRLKGRINILFHFDMNGQFAIQSINGRIKEYQKEKLEYILNNTVQLIPGKFDSKNAGIKEGMNLPLIF
ncbi:tetratricopeptide repeat protein [Robertkochia sediminum]|uniref:tetratricopeptide repeat protein n=1 Tax=Robertkochia sediminum TaxID=2785326 RepID=UPI001932E8D2|nr:hypothetical protein [Robertkochia sediminum]MBL7473789.1 hypothetical protein [Robertkochia sediminum]